MARALSSLPAPAVLLAVMLPGCAAPGGPQASTAPAHGAPFVWAMNIGGGAYVATDGTAYGAELSVTGGRVGRLQDIQATQDPGLYETYREGDIRIDKALPNGVYDVTLHFAEHAAVAAGERVFDVMLNGRTRMRGVDVLGWRDGRRASGLTVTAPGVMVTDGALSVRFKPTSGEPLLSAVVVRERIGRSDDWTLAWRDEFDVDGPPNPANWSYNVWPAGKVNGEAQAYTDRLKNVRVQDGRLVIEAHREDYDDARYTSGRIHSEGKADFLYGRFEIRARVPRGQGTWPAVWMLPSDPFRYASTCRPGADWQGSSTCDAWPNSGEIDILEHVGYQMGHVHGTVHNRAYYWVNWQQRKGRLLDPDVHEAFHVYTMEWSPERIDMYVDDVLYFTYTNDGTGWQSWPYDHPYNLIINLAIGGGWGGAGGPTDDAVLPQQLLVDWVRVYTRN